MLSCLLVKPKKDKKYMMRKRIVDLVKESETFTAEQSLDIQAIAEVELTSEDPANVIESAFRPGGSGWRASSAGVQRIKLIFDEPQQIGLVHLVFQETEQPRTQEFALRWSSDKEGSMCNLIRQQYSFSPPATTRESEDYHTKLTGVAALELEIIPDISGNQAYASIQELRLFV